MHNKVIYINADNQNVHNSARINQKARRNGEFEDEAGFI